MEYTREMDGLEFRNDVRVEGGWMYVRCWGNPKPIDFVINRSDASLINGYRWRVIDGHVYAMDETTLHLIPLENHLLRRPASEVIPHVSEDLLDCRRVNLCQPRATSPSNEYSVRGKCAFIHAANNGAKITIDREDMSRCLPFRWLIISKDRVNGACETVRAIVYRDGEKETLLLHRFLLGVPKGDVCKIRFANNDRLDFRKSNLVVVNKGKEHG